MFPSPARPKGLVSVLTLQTLNIFTKTQRTQLVAIHIISSRGGDMDPLQRSLPAEVLMIKLSFDV